MSETTRRSEGLPEGIRAKSNEIRDHRDLRVWRKSRKLAELCLDAVADFPEQQAHRGNVIRRLAGEVADEIAAGQCAGQYAAYMDHLHHARGALRHLERRLIEAHKDDILPIERGDPLLVRSAEIERMLAKLMLSLELAHARRCGRLARA